MPNPHSEDAAYWLAALESYHQDLMEGAWQQIQPHGIGEAGANMRWYRLIEAEALLRYRGEIVTVNDWLSLETAAEETLHSEDWIASVALQAADVVAKRLSWTHGPPVLLCVLCRESEAPWAANPHGYWVNKEPYDKICLPYYLLDDEPELTRAIAHEYAHVISGGLTSDHAPTWLHEAISVSAEGYVAAEDGQESTFDGLSPIAWRSTRELELLLEQENPESLDDVFIGYQQCGWIGRYLSSISAPGQLGRFLRAHGDEGFITNLMRMCRGEERVDRALRMVYGLSVRELFRRAEEYMRGERGMGS